MLTSVLITTPDTYLTTFYLELILTDAKQLKHITTTVHTSKIIIAQQPTVLVTSSHSSGQPTRHEIIYECCEYK